MFIQKQNPSELFRKCRYFGCNEKGCVEERGEGCVFVLELLQLKNSSLLWCSSILKPLLKETAKLNQLQEEQSPVKSKKALSKRLGQKISAYSH